MRINGVVETCLHVEDVARASEFYERLMGFESIAGNERLRALAVAHRQVLLLFRKGGTLEPVDLPGGRIPPHGGDGHLHVGFAISAEDLPEWERKLGEMGVAIESRVKWELGGESIYFRDLDGHLVELITPGCWPIY
jgi:catechol 2,3-dioxygenase-like lactoylglutathione lyase family enzyme